MSNPLVWCARRAAVPAFALLFFSALVPPVAGGVPDCFRGYRAQLRSVLGKAEAEEFFKIVGAFGPEAQRGTRAVLETTGDGELLYDTIFEVLERSFPPGSPANVFRRDEDLFKVIGDLAEEGDPLLLRPGLDGVIKDLTRLADGDDGFRVTQSAIFDLAMARRLAADGADYSQIVGFKKRFPVGNTPYGREPDVLTACDGCGALDGIHHENKNWTTTVFARVDGQVDELRSPPIDPQKPQFFKYTDVKLNTLASEFARDIIIHDESLFQYYRVNLGGHSFSSDELATIQQVLAKQFDSPLVVSQLSEARRETLKAAFNSKFSSIVVVY